MLAEGDYYGRSGLQIIYSRDRLGLGWAGFKDVQPHRLSYAKNWRIHLFDEVGHESNAMLGTYPGVDIRATWPDKFIIHEPRTLGALVPTRQGLGRVVVWMGMFWKFTARDWVEFVELFGKPWRIGFFAPNTGKEGKASLRNSLLRLSGYTTAIFEKGCEPKFISPEHDKTPHQDQLAEWKTEVSKLINGATLQTERGGSVGSNAMAQVHERAEQRIIKKNGAGIEQTLRCQAFRPLVRMQFGEEAAQIYTPILSLDTDPPRDVIAEATRVFAFIDRGGEVDEDQFREVFTPFRKPAPGAKLLKPIGPQAAGATESEESEQDEDEDDHGGEDSNEDEKDE
jgi:phage gp29-like protein